MAEIMHSTFDLVTTFINFRFAQCLFHRSGVMTLWLSAAGIILPFGLGAVAAFIIFKLQNSLHHPNFGAFVLFLGVALSVTAFPVLARILTERKLLHTDV